MTLTVYTDSGLLTVALEDPRLCLQTVERKITVNLKLKAQPKYHSRVNIK